MLVKSLDKPGRPILVPGGDPDDRDAALEGVPGNGAGVGHLGGIAVPNRDQEIDLAKEIAASFHVALFPMPSLLVGVATVGVHPIRRLR